MFSKLNKDRSGVDTVIYMCLYVSITFHRVLRYCADPGDRHFEALQCVEILIPFK